MKTLVTLPWALLCATCLGWLVIDVCFFLLCTCFGRLICWYWCLLFCCVLPNIIFSFSAACCLSRIYGHWWLFICCVLPLDIFCCLLPSLNQHLQVQIKLLTSPAPIFSLTLLCLSLLLWLCLTTTTTRRVSFSAQFMIETHWSFELLFKKHRCLPGGWRQLREDQLVGKMLSKSSWNLGASLNCTLIWPKKKRYVWVFSWTACILYCAVFCLNVWLFSGFFFCWHSLVLYQYLGLSLCGNKNHRWC